MDWTPDERDKALAVVLNKVDGLWWAYYAVDVASDAKPISDVAARAVLDAIVARDGRFVWTGADAQQDALFPLLLRIYNDHPDLAAEAFRRIFDMNVVPDESGATGDNVARLNDGERKARLDAYLRSVRSRRCENRKILVAEGDSWFQFPGRWFFFFGVRWMHFDAVKDILDHLIASPKYCVRSLAAGGDWLIKMLRANDYVEPLSQIEPDAFLLSAGGNDLLGDGRVANMTLHKRRWKVDPARNEEILKARLAAVEGRDVVFDREMYARGVYFLAKEFVSFLNLVLVQYAIFFSALERSKLAEMRILTHGYDFAIPTQHSTARLISVRRLVNKMLGSGKWLWLPLEQKRLDDTEKQAVVYAMITEFNELLVSMAMSPRFPSLYHVDCRGIARSPADWYDEIHLTSKAFKRAASLFDVCLTKVLAADGDAAKKVFTVADLH